MTNIVSNGNYRYYELDVYIPELKIAFDFNGTYYHSEKFKDHLYHHRKTVKCYEQGILFINIYEYDWDNRQEEIKNNIKKVLNNKWSCIEIGWIPTELYDQYTLSEPNVIDTGKFIIYDAGHFIHK